MRHLGQLASKARRWMDISPLNTSPLFASGDILAMTCFDRFAIEALFTPQVVPLVRMLAFGDQQGNRLQQTPCPTDFQGERWEDVRELYMRAGKLLLGLLRGVGPDSADISANFSSFNYTASASTEPAPCPYVITNPAPRTVLLDSDLLFLIGPSLPMETAAPGRISTRERASFGQTAPEAPEVEVQDELHSI